MAILVEKSVDEVGFHIKKLTIREIYDLFGKAMEGRDGQDGGEEPDWIGNTLFEEVTIRDLLTFTDLDRDRIMEMLPESVEKIIAEVKKENPHFFAACRKLEEAGKRLESVMSKPSDGVLTGTTSSDSKPVSLL